MKTGGERGLHRVFLLFPVFLLSRGFGGLWGGLNDQFYRKWTRMGANGGPGGDFCSRKTGGLSSRACRGIWASA